MFTFAQMIQAQIQNSFSCCLACGRFSVTKSHFCRDCGLKLKGYLRKSNYELIAEGERLRGMSIFDWIENESLPVSKLIMAQKNGDSLYASQYWGRKLALEWIKRSPRAANENWVVVPAPRRKKTRLDHGYWLAKSVASTLSLPLVDGLIRSAPTELKTVNKSQRMQALVVCHEKISQDMSVLFVDDVLTSGATAIQSYLALDKPQRFEILTLARRDLAGTREQ